VRDLLFVWLEVENGTHVIGCVDIQTRQLNILDFYLELPIESITVFDQGSLIVHTESDNSDSTKHNFYKVPFG
jgi:hypothetical protein